MNFGNRSKMNLEEIDIHTLLPQQPPFVMVGKLTHFDEIVTTTQFTLTDDNLFVENGIFSAEGMMENIAQTCAARMGYINKFICKENVKLGFIGAVRDYKVLRNPRVGETLVTSIAVKEEVMRMTLVDASVEVNGEVIASAQMKIALSEIDSAV